MADDGRDYSLYELVIGCVDDDKEQSTAVAQEEMKKPTNKIYAEVAKNFKYISRHLDETNGIKVENLVGFSQIPMGLAGPLHIRGHYQKGDFFIPLATIEAALVASISRGCKAFQRCGGVKAWAMSEGMGRAPVFLFRSVDDAVAFYKRLPELQEQLRKYAEATSRYVRLLRLTPQILGTYVHVLFEYACGDAAGQNMVTIATHKACSALFDSPLGKELGILDMYSEGHMCADKQIIAGGGTRNPRGVQVIAWGVLSDETCREVLHTSAKRIHDVLTTAMEAAVRNAQVGNSVNASNALMAMFLALGQDPASVIDACWAQTTAQYNNETKELSLAMYIPSLPVGSVGGGTSYPTQKEALEVIGCAGPGKKWALAETIAAFALALDISTGSSIASDQHASGHEKLARMSKL